MRTLPRLLAACALASAGVLPAIAQTSAAPAATPQVDAENFPTLSCDDFLRAAKVAVPPKNASAQQRRRAEGAQDAIMAAMVWMHGYLAGRNTPELGKISREWVQQTVARMAQECQAAPEPQKLLLVDVAAKS